MTLKEGESNSESTKIQIQVKENGDDNLKKKKLICNSSKHLKRFLCSNEYGTTGEFNTLRWKRNKNEKEEA